MDNGYVWNKKRRNRSTSKLCVYVIKESDKMLDSYINNIEIGKSEKAPKISNKVHKHSKSAL